MGRKSQKNILKKTKLFLTGIVIIQLETMIFSHLTDFSLENTMILSIYVVFLHFPEIPGNFFGISRISRFPGKNFGPGNRQPYSGPLFWHDLCRRGWGLEHVMYSENVSTSNHTNTFCNIL